MTKPVNLKTSVPSYLVRNSEKTAASLVQPLRGKPYTQEQIQIIETKLAECEELLKQYPYNIAARKTREICMNMLKPANQQI